MLENKLFGFTVTEGSSETITESMGAMALQITADSANTADVLITGFVTPSGKNPLVFPIKAGASQTFMARNVSLKDLIITCPTGAKFAYVVESQN